MSGQDTPHVVILGGGPAGVGGAYQLRRTCRAEVTLLEAQSGFGGNAGSFEAFGQYLDYGSHRLHHATDPAILADIQQLLGSDLLHRPRHGRIRLRGKWLHFPLKPMDLMLRLDRRFAIGTARDMVMRRVSPREEGDTFASVLEANLGSTVCHRFYFPYARKIWGREPEELSGIAARKRVSAGSFGKMLKRLVKPPGDGFYYYPRKGYGQISNAYAEAATELGATLHTGTRVTRIRRTNGDASGWTVEAERQGGEPLSLQARHLWSTIPTPLLARMLDPAPDATVLDAARSMAFRSMVLVYAQLDCPRFSGTDAHYFPEAAIRMTRLSEPKNYSAANEPAATTTLCAEYPCTVGDDIWQLDDAGLKDLLMEDLARAGIAPAKPPIAIMARRLPQAYPIYTLGFERAFGALDAWVDSLPDVLVYGRQGLFAHDNLHHALFMAYSAADCLVGGHFDHERWGAYRRVFEGHVVED